MSGIAIPKKLKTMLEKADWICLATRNQSGDPNAANKFLLACENDYVLIVDFVKGSTLDNIRHYPMASFPIIDLNNLIDYQFFGKVEIIEEGPLHEKLIKALEEKHTRFSTNRIIEGIRRSKKFNNNVLPDATKAVIFKIAILDIVVRGPRVELK